MLTRDPAKRNNVDKDNNSDRCCSESRPATTVTAVASSNDTAAILQLCETAAARSRCCIMNAVEFVHMPKNNFSRRDYVNSMVHKEIAVSCLRPSSPSVSSPQNNRSPLLTFACVHLVDHGSVFTPKDSNCTRCTLKTLVNELKRIGKKKADLLVVIDRDSTASFIDKVSLLFRVFDTPDVATPHSIRWYF